MPSLFAILLQEKMAHLQKRVELGKDFHQSEEEELGAYDSMRLRSKMFDFGTYRSDFLSYYLHAFAGAHGVSCVSKEAFRHNHLPQILLMSTKPFITAYIVSADTLFILSFSIMFLRWVTTVDKPMFSLSAISLLI